MTYFADLTIYTYGTFQQDVNPKVLNIGWLDGRFPFDRGSVSDEILKRLFELCKKPVMLTRGFHSCPFGGRESPPLRCPNPVYATSGNWKLQVANGEIRVQGENRIVYAAPTMIYHYIQRHQYCPPSEFLKAVGKH